MYYAVDVCSHFSFLPIENTSVMESNADKIPVDRTVTRSSVPTLAREAVATPTNMDNRATVEFSLAQPPSSCVGNLSEPAVVPDVDLGNDSVVAPSAVSPASRDGLVPPDNV